MLRTIRRGRGEQRTANLTLVALLRLAIYCLNTYTRLTRHDAAPRLKRDLLPQLRELLKEEEHGVIDDPELVPDPESELGELDQAMHLRTMYMVAENALWSGAECNNPVGPKGWEMNDADDLAERVENERISIDEWIARRRTKIERHLGRVAARRARR